MLSPFIRRLLLAVIVVTPVLNASDRWIRLTTPHFEMYTTNSDKQGVAALQLFEQVRYFFLQSRNTKETPSTPVRIIAFRSEQEYKRYRLNDSAFAYYLQSRKADYIVMQDISPEHYRAAVHEYTHLIVRHHNLTFPVWLNEGLADFYSSLEPRGEQAMVGRVLPDSWALLKNTRWLNLDFLFSVDQDSPYYNEREKASIFYSESWVLTHMLSLGNDYRPGFSKFLSQVAAGHPVPECLQSVYGKTVAQVMKDLHAYVNRATLSAAVYNIKLPKSDLEPVESEPSDLSVELALDDLLASKKVTESEASERLNRLAVQHPESAEVQESLGYLEWQQGDLTRAKECFKLSVDKGSRNPEMITHYASLLNDSGASAEQLLPLLRKVVELDPGYPDGWLQLGTTATRAGQYSVALEALLHVQDVDPDRAYSLFSAKAYCYSQLRSPKEALEMAEKAKQYARTPQQQLEAENLLSHLGQIDHQDRVQASASARASSLSSTDAPDRPKFKRSVSELPRDQSTVQGVADLQHVESVVKFLDCSASTHRLHVIVDSQEMVFRYDDPKGIVVRNGGEVDFRCGAQKAMKLGIFYTPLPQPAPADGTIRELVY